MRKPTCILHYGAGVVAALATLFYSIPVGILLVTMFTVLEVWDAARGHDSWWDYQEFLLAYFLVCTLALVAGLVILICEVCQ